MTIKHTRPLFKLSLLSLAVAANLVQAQDASTDKQEVEEVMVTGYRATLQNAMDAKRESQGFSDAVFADDIGKMPSQNLAESLNRIPGVKIAREVTGEGLQISVRGLGSSFTKINLNGNNISVASDGALDSGGRGREVDLGMFPTELFSKLSVSKSADAAQMEGGISGYVDMRTARAFDNPGQHIKYSVKGSYTEINEEMSPKGSFIYSNTWDDRFGVLVGVTTSQVKSRVDGYETIGYTDGCLVNTPTSDNALSCQAGMVGRNQFHWNPVATPDYAATHPGVAVGDTLDLLATSGATATELDHGLMPYLGRASKVEGDRNATTELVSLEFRPDEGMSFALDLMATQATRDFNRIDSALWVRRANNQSDGLIPENVVVDENEVVREATLYNSQLWVEARDYTEDVDFLSVMPSFSWQLNDGFKLDISASHTESEFRRVMPTWLYTTPKGVTEYSLGANGVGNFSFSVPNSDFDLNGATGWIWGGGGSGPIRFNIDARDTETNGLHADFALGEDADRNGIKFGISYDDAARNMQAYGNGDAQAVTLAGAPDINDFLRPMETDFGHTMDGAGIGYNGWAQLDYAAIKSTYDYNALVKGATRGGDAFGQTVGDIDETYTAAYLMINSESQILNRDLRTNLGLRFVNTEQYVASLNTSTQVVQSTSSEYQEWLPSFSAVYDLNDTVKLRAAASRSMTRPNPADMFPNASWSSSGIDTARAGNPGLDPYFSQNVDIGGEWYFSDMGYVGLTFFQKNVNGFTYTDNQTVKFEDLNATYGLDTSSLSEAQQASLTQCGGPSVCNVTVSTRLNVKGSTDLLGSELTWVQPLDFIVDGLGFDASATHIEQNSSNRLAEVTGLSDWAYNFTGFYENEDLSVRVTYYHQDMAKASGFLDSNYDGDPLPARFRYALARSQVDLSASYNLPFAVGSDGEMVVTFDAYNLTNEPVGNWYGYEGVAESYYNPGVTYTVGISGKF
jgi:TonB-dependent receptor